MSAPSMRSEGRVLRATALAILFTLSACAEAITGIASRGANAAFEERSVGDAVDDAGVKLQLNAALLNHSGDLFTDVTTQVLEGRVLLTGAVERAEDAVAAVRIAWTVPGVREVIDELEVTRSGATGDLAQDAWISAQVRTRLLTDADVWHLNYSVRTQSRVVYLMGIALSPGELLRVVDHARSVPNVERVVSHVLYRDDPRRPAPERPDRDTPTGG